MPFNANNKPLETLKGKRAIKLRLVFNRTEFMDTKLNISLDIEACYNNKTLGTPTTKKPPTTGNSS